MDAVQLFFGLPILFPGIGIALFVHHGMKAKGLAIGEVFNRVTKHRVLAFKEDNTKAIEAKAEAGEFHTWTEFYNGEAELDVEHATYAHLTDFIEWHKRKHARSDDNSRAGEKMQQVMKQQGFYTDLAALIQRESAAHELVNPRFAQHLRVSLRRIAKVQSELLDAAERYHSNWYDDDEDYLYGRVRNRAGTFRSKKDWGSALQQADEVKKKNNSWASENEVGEASFKNLLHGKVA